MALTLAERPKSEILKRTIAHVSTGVHELVAFCPKCKAMETLWFANAGLMQTRKFTQNGDGVYHDCGSVEPCRLYRGC